MIEKTIALKGLVTRQRRRNIASDFADRIGGERRQRRNDCRPIGARDLRCAEQCCELQRQLPSLLGRAMLDHRVEYSRVERP